MSIQTEPVENQAATEQQEQAAGFRHVLKNRKFLLLWMAQLVSQTILHAANFGLVMLASEHEGGALMASLAVIAFVLPAVPFSALAGVIVDRLDKRMVMWVSNLARMLISLLMFAWLLYDRTNIWPLLALMFLTSLVGQFFLPAEGAAIPLIVGGRGLMPALSLFSVTATLSQAIGFLIIGRLIVGLFVPFTMPLGILSLDVHPIDMLFLIITVLYGVCVIFVLLVPPATFKEAHLQKKAQQPQSTSVKQMMQMLWQETVEGWQIMRANHLLFFSVVHLSMIGAIVALIGALAGTFVKIILERPAEDMAIVLAPAGIGLIGTSILMPHISKYISKVRLTNIGLIWLTIGFCMVPLFHWTALFFDPQHGSQSPLLFVSIVLLILSLGVAISLVTVPTTTLLQEQVTENGRARVLSLQFMIYSAGTIPILLFAGIMTEVLGLAAVVFLCAALVFGFYLWGRYYLKSGNVGNTDSVAETVE